MSTERQKGNEMPMKQTLWICDHCSKQAIQREIPRGWVTAKVSDPGIANTFKDFLWCDGCWKKFEERLPEVVVPTW